MHWIMENHIFRVERQDNLKCKKHFEGSDKKVGTIHIINLPTLG